MTTHPNQLAHDPAGWRNHCRCGRMYWAAWRAHDQRVIRMELDEVTPHQCKEKSE